MTIKINHARRPKGVRAVDCEAGDPTPTTPPSKVESIAETDDCVAVVSRCVAETGDCVAVASRCVAETGDCYAGD
jgi:hypothetical protein